MVIRDKQTLRRCVKQAVRRAQIVETQLRFDVMAGELGVDAASRAFKADGGTPFSPDAAAMYAALDALDLPVYDLRRAQEEIETYERGAYLRELLDARQAQSVFVRIPLEHAGEAFFGDDRFEALLAVDKDAFVPGRYGVNYERTAQEIAGALHTCGAKELLAEGVTADALRWALLPLCEDEGCRLHIGLRDADEVAVFASLMDEFPDVDALVWAQGDGERALIAAAAQNPHILVRLCDAANLSLALGSLGTRFLAYAAQAEQPEIAVGRWITFRERLHPLLTECYLPLARAGFELTSEMVNRDVQMLLGGCLQEE